MENKINVVTVAMDPFIDPYIGEFVGNAFFVGVKFGNGTIDFTANTIFEKAVSSKELSAFFIKSAIKSFFNGTLKIDSHINKGFSVMGTIPYDVVLHRYVVKIENKR